MFQPVPTKGFAMKMIRKSLAVLPALILAAPFYLADHAAAGVGGSDHYDGNNWNKRYNEGFYSNSGAGVPAGSAIGAIGSSVSRLPGNCVSVTYGGVAYRKCGSYWMQPRYRGSTVVYVRVRRPY